MSPADQQSGGETCAPLFPGRGAVAAVGHGVRGYALVSVGLASVSLSLG